MKAEDDEAGLNSEERDKLILSPKERLTNGSLKMSTMPLEQNKAFAKPESIGI